LTVKLRQFVADQVETAVRQTGASVQSTGVAFVSPITPMKTQEGREPYSLAQKIRVLWGGTKKLTCQTYVHQSAYVV
jgi:hypothetical protein